MRRNRHSAKKPNSTTISLFGHDMILVAGTVMKFKAKDGTKVPELKITEDVVKDPQKHVGAWLDSWCVKTINGKPVQ